MAHQFQLEALTEHEPVPGFHGRFVHTEDMTLSYWRVDAGSALPEHAHPHKQITQIIEGTFEMTLDGTSGRFGPGSVIVIPGNITHSGRALTDCIIHDIFMPVRKDYAALDQKS